MKTHNRTGPLFLLVFASLAGHTALRAQSLNWEGQTGAFTTPFAYTAPSGQGLGRPAVGFHYLDGGPAIGGYYQSSVTVGLLKRAEFGYTRGFHQMGRDAALSGLWTGGINTVHAKLNVIPENAAKHPWIPAVSGGFVARSQVRNVGGVLGSHDTHNGDVYVVATKTVTQVKGLPMVFSGGVRGTNASVFGLVGNAPGFQARAFGGAAFVARGPAKSSLIFGSEFSQQPRRVEGLPGAVIPTTVDYFVRIVPAPEFAKLNVDFGVAQVAGAVLPGVHLGSRHQFAMGVSYRF